VTEEANASLARIGRNLARHRKRAGLTQQALAELSGYSRTTVKDVERGKINPTIATLIDLSMACNTSISIVVTTTPLDQLA